MTAGAYITRNEKTLSGALTLVMHLLFFALLVSGVTWQKHHQPEAMVVDLWNTLPPLPSPKPAPEVKPPPAPPAPKVEAKPVPKVEPKPVVKPDIAFKEKKEKERKAKEEALAEKKKREQEQARLAMLKEQQAKEAEAKRLAREQEEALKKIAAQQAAAQTKLIDEYIGKIQAKIRSRVNRAGCASLTNPEIQVRVILLPDGNVLAEPEIRKSSGSSPSCDSAVTKAVLLAQPLPLPPDPALFPRFRELNLPFTPNKE